MKNFLSKKYCVLRRQITIGLVYFFGWIAAITLAYLQKSTLSASLSIFLSTAFLFAVFFADRFDCFVDSCFAFLNLGLGALLEVFLIKSRSISYGDDFNNFCPFWVLSLYPLFALFLHYNLTYLKKHTYSGFILGGCGGAYLYYFCQKLQLVHVISYPKAAFFWALYFPLALYLSADFKKGEKKALHDENKGEPFTVLYDGACKVCDKEISLLKRKEKHPIYFVDISSKSYDPLQHRNISFSEAMTQIHGYFEHESTVKGVAALSILYARTNKTGVAFFLNLNTFLPLWKLLYRLFARIRFIFHKKN